MKNRHILVLAANGREGSKYAKNSNLPNFTYRIIRAASSITGIQSVDVHLVDGFEKRPDAGAILARLRWARDIAYYSVSMPPEPVTDEGDGLGPQLEIDFDAATDETPEPAAESLDHVVPSDEAAEQAQEPDTSNGDNMTAEGAPAPKPRRKRCKVCGRLTAKPFDENREGHDDKAHSTGSLFA